jgi:hypothetical protein
MGSRHRLDFVASIGPVDANGKWKNQQEAG